MRAKSILAGLFLAALLAPAAAHAENAYVVSRGAIRAGPDTDYPIIVVLGKGNPLFLYGCLDGWNWCDVSWGAYRGWMRADHLDYVYRGQRVLVPQYGARTGLPILSFSFNYWDDHYRGKTFYRQRDVYIRRHPNAYHGPDRRGPDYRGPDRRGPDYRGPDRRGPDYRGPDRRGPDYRGPDRRGPDYRGPDRRGPDYRGSNRSAPNRPGPDQAGQNRPEPNRPGPNRPGPDRPNANRPNPDRGGHDRRGDNHPGPDRPDRGGPGGNPADRH